MKWLDKYSEDVPKAQAGKDISPTRADSLAVYNQSRKVQEYYKNYRKDSEISTEGWDGIHRDNDRTLKLFLTDGSVKVAGTNNKTISVSPLKKHLRQEVDKNKYYQRESVNALLDTRAPAQLFDRRIMPTHMTEYTNTNQKDPFYMDIVGIYTYDPIAIKPFDLLTEKEKAERVKKYGNDGVPKSYLNKIAKTPLSTPPKKQPHPITQPLLPQKPTSRKKQTPISTIPLAVQPINSNLEIKTSELSPMARVPKKYKVETSGGGKFGGWSRSETVIDPDNISVNDGNKRTITPIYQDGGNVDPVAMRGMMKSKIGMGNALGHPAIKRMSQAQPKTGMTPEGIGTHYMSSVDNYAVPLLQDLGEEQLTLIDPDSRSKEAIRFNSPEEAQYFAENYKDVAPMSTIFKDVPKAQSGNSIKKKPIVVSDEDNPRYKAYQDSLNLHNESERYLKIFNSKIEPLLKKGKNKEANIYWKEKMLDSPLFESSYYNLKKLNNKVPKKIDEVESKYNKDFAVYLFKKPTQPVILEQRKKQTPLVNPIKVEDKQYTPINSTREVKPVVRSPKKYKIVDTDGEGAWLGGGSTTQTVEGLENVGVNTRSKRTITPIYQFGGNKPSSESIDYDYVNYGTPEYEEAYKQGKFAHATNQLDEIVVTPYDKQYPHYQSLSPQQKKFINDDSPIGRQIRGIATDGVGFNAEKAEKFAMGWLRDLPLSSLQAPQSALVEGVEALRGKDYNFLNALEPDKQRIPSETWGIKNPYAAFAVDAITDPELLTGVGMATSLPRFGKKLGQEIVETNVPTLKDLKINQLSSITNDVPINNFEIQPWQMEELPGLHLQSTMENGAISRIIEPKTGLINTEQALAIIGKESGGADKVAIIKQGLGENIPKKMDYNEFRKITQDQLIPLEHHISTSSKSNYGLGSLGYPSPSIKSYKQALSNTEESINNAKKYLEQNNIKQLEYEFKPVYEVTDSNGYKQVFHTMDEAVAAQKQSIDVANQNIESMTTNRAKTLEEMKSLPLENETLLLSNKSKFGRGSNAHNNPDETLGHLHFLRDAETPDVLTVTQIQSDAFQGTHRTMPKNAPDVSKVEKSLQRMQELQERNKSVLNKMKTEGVDEAGLPVQQYQIKQFEDIVQAQEAANLMKKGEVENFTQKSLLDKNHQERYLQELVDYAGKRGDVNKVRVPTSETAANVQNYYKSDRVTLKNSDIDMSDMDMVGVQNFIEMRKKGLSKDEILREIDPDLPYEALSLEDKKLADILYNEPIENFNFINDYEDIHKTILKKYSEQPKLIKKLFGEEPKIVTDSKGNSWYEFNIPDKFKKGKGEIKAFSTLGAVGTAGANSQGNTETSPIKKNGGVIKDNRGQWSHPGEITEINSPDITMQGVSYPVLGVSKQTGEQKMMFPEKNYKFANTKSVIEKPISKNWLDKYENGGELPKAQRGKTIITDERQLGNTIKDNIQPYSLKRKDTVPLTKEQIAQRKAEEIKARQGEIRQHTPQSTMSKAKEIALNPMTAFGYVARNEQLPENFSKGNRVGLDYAIDVVNPVQYVEDTKNVVQGAYRGDLGQVGEGLLGVVPMGLEAKNIYKGIKNIPTGIAPELRQGLQTNGISFANNPKRGENAFKLINDETEEWIGDLDLTKNYWDDAAENQWTIDNVGIKKPYRGKGFGKEAYIKANELLNSTNRGDLYSSGMFEGPDAKHLWRSLVKSGDAEEIGKNAWKFKSKLEQGGIIKDDMGYWNPDNVGKTVEIGSGNITMEGVNQPLLGISKRTITPIYQFGGNKPMSTWETQQAKVKAEKDIQLQKLLKDKSYIKNLEKESANRRSQVPTEQYITINDVTNVPLQNKPEKTSVAARNKTNKEIAQERQARIDAQTQANAQPFDWSNFRQSLADRSQATGDALRVSNEPNFFDDYVNPAVMIGSMADNLGQAPLRAQQEDSYMPYITAVGTPLLVGRAIGSGSINPVSKNFWTKSVSNKSFVNNLANPLAGTGDLVNNLGNKYLPNAYKLNPLAKKAESFNNPNSFYRQVDDETFREGIESGLIRGKQNVDKTSGESIINLNKSFGDDAYYKKGSLYSPQRADYIYEVNKGEEFFIPKVNNRTRGYTTENTPIRVSKTPIPLEEASIYQKDWLKGYKQVDTPITSPINNIDTPHNFKNISFNDAEDDGFQSMMKRMQDRKKAQDAFEMNKADLLDPETIRRAEALGIDPELMKHAANNMTYDASILNPSHFDSGQMLININPKQIGQKDPKDIMESILNPVPPNFTANEIAAHETGHFFQNTNIWKEAYPKVMPSSNRKLFHVAKEIMPEEFEKIRKYWDKYSTRDSAPTKVDEMFNQLTFKSDLHPTINNSAVKNKQYFENANDRYGTTIDNSVERLPMFREYRQGMRDLGILKNKWDDITPEHIEAFMKAKPENRINSFMEPTQANYNLINEVSKIAPVLVPTVGATYMASQQNSSFKNGGVIKDDMGQWNHPGEITEINSPDITMQGVSYPVLGISKQTGEQKIMFPGKNYKFANTKQVVEYPMVGKGWLDKYN